LYLKWFLLLIKICKIVSKSVSKLVTNVLVINILDSKLVSERLKKTNLKYKVVSN